MAVTSVADIINNAKVVLQEVADTGIRWTNPELVNWLNEFYQAAAQVKPDACSVNEQLELAAGTRQAIPDNGLRLIEVVRNTGDDSDGSAVMLTSRQSLDRMRRRWHADPAEASIELYVFDDMDPRSFYVYPPAKQGAALEIIYSKVAEPHDPSKSLETLKSEKFRLNDALAPAATDYVLARAFAKDAEHSANLNRSQMHRNAYMQQLTGKIQSDQRSSPNAPDMSANAQE